MRDVEIKLDSFDNITKMLEEATTLILTERISSEYARVLVAVASAARDTITDKAKYQKAINDLQQKVGAAGERQVGDKPMTGNPFKIPSLVSQDK
jgi:flagellar hook-length control protein FliK